MKLALLKEFQVVDIIDIDVNDEDLIKEYSSKYQIIDVTNFNPYPEVGWVFDGSNIVPKTGMGVPPPKRLISKLAFRQRITLEEKIAIYTAKKTNVILEVFLDDLAASQYVDLGRGDTRNGVLFLAQKGILTMKRALEILDNPIIEQERYKGSI